MMALRTQMHIFWKSERVNIDWLTFQGVLFPQESPESRFQTDFFGICKHSSLLPEENICLNFFKS